MLSTLLQISYKTKKEPAIEAGFMYGPEGIRTLDLSDANRTLSQLSHGP